jgi:hypothetical protein
MDPASSARRESFLGGPGFLTVSDESVSRARWSGIRVAQWVTIIVLVVISELVAWAGHSAASYGVDGLALVSYLSFRWWRRSPAHHG